jgi:hypothetical protein
MILRLLRDLVLLVSLALRSRAQLSAENLFLRKQLALYLRTAGQADDATRITFVALARFVAWRRLLTIVTPDTLIRWHREGFRLFWRWKSRAPGRPPIPADLQPLIATMALANRTWGEERLPLSSSSSSGFDFAANRQKGPSPQNRRSEGCFYSGLAEPHGRSRRGRLSSRGTEQFPNNVLPNTG